ncbi:MAG: methionine synthase [Arachnia sp.]
MRITTAGSVPGTDFAGALAAMTELTPDIVAWPELPARGVGSQLVGHALGIIDGLGFDLQPGGWRLAAHAGADHRRARATWRHNLDDAEEVLQGFQGALKVGVAGPWTLSAMVDRPAGDRLLADHGARRELAQALEQAVGSLLGELERRVPGVDVWLQVDEPLLVAVSSGAVATASGFSRHRAVDDPAIVAALAPLIRLREHSSIHCCAAGDWLGLADHAGASAVAVDSRWFRTVGELEVLARWLDAGRDLILGVVDTSHSKPQPTDALVAEALRVLRPLELGAERAAPHVVLGTGCGMAGAAAGDIAPQLRALREAAGLVEDLLT